MKPRIAIFSLTGCEGCSLAILELEDHLLDLLGAVEIVNFREGMSEKHWDIDVGFVDGAVSTPQDEEELRHYRDCCKTLVALGACACLGGVNTLKNTQAESNYRRYVYGDRAAWFPTRSARPIADVVKVDFELPGCPVTGNEFVELVLCLLAGKAFHLPQYPVCVECKKRGNPCVYEKGMVCLGPLTRAGCGAICPSVGMTCDACRGVVHAEALAAASINMRDPYHLSRDDLLDRLRLFGNCRDGVLP